MSRRRDVHRYRGADPWQPKAAVPRRTVHPSRTSPSRVCGRGGVPRLTRTGDDYRMLVVVHGSGR
jgi:hypothetical protein